MNHMRRGEWHRAWRISDAVLRYRAGQEQFQLPRHLQAVWKGEPLQDRRVLVRCYHGLGYTIQFVRFAPLLRRIARRVIVWAQPSLLPLLQYADGIDELLPLHDGTPEVDRDVDIEVMELPHALRITLDNLPAEVPYLRLPPRPVLQRDPQPLSQPVSQPLSEPAPLPVAPGRVDRQLSVGVVWQSGDWDPRRSVPLQLLQPLMDSQAVRWKILQRGPALERWPRDHPAQVPRIRNILEEAAELQALDLLITVDTLSAHLAGALGVRTWTLLHAEADWRWIQGRDDTPWYPTMRLFRQRCRGDWHPVLERVRAELQSLTGPAARRNTDCCCPSTFRELNV